VTPEEAEKLALAATEGKLQLVLRNSVDDESVTTRGIDKKGLLGMIASNHAPPAPAAAAGAGAGSRAPARPRPVSIPVTAIPPPPKPAVQTVEIIEAGKRRLLEFPQ
jgi:pilus assembly protein CpaB